MDDKQKFIDLLLWLVVSLFILGGAVIAKLLQVLGWAF